MSWPRRASTRDSCGVGNASHRHYSNNPHPYGLIRYPFGPELASRCNHVALQRPVKRLQHRRYEQMRCIATPLKAPGSALHK